MLSPTDSTPDRNPSPTPFSQILVARDSRPGPRHGAASDESRVGCAFVPSSIPISRSNKPTRHCAIGDERQRAGIARYHRLDLLFDFVVMLKILARLHSP